MTKNVIGIGNGIKQLPPSKFFQDWRRIAFLIGRSQDALVKLLRPSNNVGREFALMARGNQIHHRTMIQLTLNHRLTIS